MKVLLIGANGQLGTDVSSVFKQEFELVPLTVEDIDIADPAQARAVIEKHRPGVVINTAAYHNVPECEKSPDKAFLINSIAVRNLVLICRDIDARLIHISTDYVFDGRKKSPYTENDSPHPLNVYAISKLAGELFATLAPKHYLIRVAGLFGLAGCMGKGGTNFIEAIIKNAAQKPVLQVTSNIISSPTYTYDAALQIKAMLKADMPSGLYHLTNSGSCSWYEFAQEIDKLVGLKVKIEPKEETEEQAGVRRPLYSVLNSTKLQPLRSWQDALKDYISKRKK
ncbi:MAG: dTDP-4-dehydrorhamnose reductase [Candidatus Brocadiia bacterium]